MSVCSEFTDTAHTILNFVCYDLFLLSRIVRPTFRYSVSHESSVPHQFRCIAVYSLASRKNFTNSIQTQVTGFGCPSFVQQLFIRATYEATWQCPIQIQSNFVRLDQRTKGTKFQFIRRQQENIVVDWSQIEDDSVMNSALKYRNINNGHTTME